MGRVSSNVGVGFDNNLLTNNGARVSIGGLEKPQQQIIAGVVTRININPDNPSNMGAIEFQIIGSEESGNKKGYAFPLNSTMKQFPVINEPVVIFEIGGRYYWMCSLNAYNRTNNNHNSNILPKIKVSNIPDYKTNIETGVPKNPDKEDVPYMGDSFLDKNSEVGFIKPNEGDVIYGGRFGNTLRFGNNPETNKPNIKLSIGVGNKGIYSENINKDGGIWLTSDEHISFNSFSPPMTEKVEIDESYKGQQLSLFSDRIVIGARSSSLLLMASRNISFSTNDTLSVDAKNKIIMNSDNNIELKTSGESIISSEKDISCKSNNDVKIESTKNTSILSEVDILLNAKNAIGLTASSNIVIKMENNSVGIGSDGIQLASSSDILVKGDGEYHQDVNGNIDIKSGENINIDGKDVNIKGENVNIDCSEFVVDSGDVLLGSSSADIPTVRGDDLKDILLDLVDSIIEHIHVGMGGPVDPKTIIKLTRLRSVISMGNFLSRSVKISS